MTNSFHPIIHESELDIIDAGERTTSDRSLVVNAHSSIQLASPLQPHPAACGRLRYVEFELVGLNSRASVSSLIVGFGLPGIEGQWLGKTRGSVAVDFFASCVYEGSRIATELDPIELKGGHFFGVGICHECHNDELQMDCFFATHNGKVIYESRSLASANRGFSLVGIHSSIAMVVLETNHGAKPFCFDLAAFQQNHSTHPFYRTYLPFSAFNVGGSEIYWTNSRICHQFAFKHHYKPILDALKHLPHPAYHERVAALQLQIFRWQKLFALFHRDETLDINSTLPQHFDSIDALFTTLVAEDFEPFTVDFTADIPAVRQALLRSMTDLRYKIQMELLKTVAEFYCERPSLFEDAKEIRSGLFEGHIKLALHLADSVRHEAVDRPWLALIMNYTLDDLVESNIDLAANCPGYMDAVVEEHAEGEDSTKSDEEASKTENPELSSTDAVVPSTEAEEVPAESSPEEDELASRMVTIGSAVRAWASWAGAYIGGLELHLEAPSKPSEDLEAVPKDITLSFLSKGLASTLSARFDPETQLPAGANWLLLQYLSLGFARDSPINMLPLSAERAIACAQKYFETLCAQMTPSDLEVLQEDTKLLTTTPNSPHLEYLKYQYELAMGAWPTDFELCEILQAQAPSGSLSSARAAPRLPTRAIATQMPASTASSKPHSSSASGGLSSGWMIAAGVGIAAIGASLGAMVAIWATSKPRRTRR